MAAIGRLHYDVPTVMGWKSEMNKAHAHELGTKMERFPLAEGNLSDDEDKDSAPRGKGKRSAGAKAQYKKIRLNLDLGDKGMSRSDAVVDMTYELRL
jgi:hypothetical protein